MDMTTNQTTYNLPSKDELISVEQDGSGRAVTVWTVDGAPRTIARGLTAMEASYLTANLWDVLRTYKVAG